MLATAEKTEKKEPTAAELRTMLAIADKKEQANHNAIMFSALLDDDEEGASSFL